MLSVTTSAHGSGRRGRRTCGRSLITVLLSLRGKLHGRLNFTQTTRHEPTGWIRQTRRLCWLKELRPGSTGRTEIRVLFPFDKERKAILLAGGDKSADWKGWYRENIPVADARYDEHQARIEKARATKRVAHREHQQRKGRGRP